MVIIENGFLDKSHGIKIAQGINTLSTSNISQGIYIIIVQGENPIAQKILIK